MIYSATFLFMDYNSCLAVIFLKIINLAVHSYVMTTVLDMLSIVIAIFYGNGILINQNCTFCVTCAKPD